jgi:hypothetical protein
VGFGADKRTNLNKGFEFKKFYYFIFIKFGVELLEALEASIILSRFISNEISLKLMKISS